MPFLALLAWQLITQGRSVEGKKSAHSADILMFIPHILDLQSCF